MTTCGFWPWYEFYCNNCDIQPCETARLVAALREAREERDGLEAELNKKQSQVRVLGPAVVNAYEVLEDALAACNALDNPGAWGETLADKLA